VLRSFSDERAREFYLGFMGFKVNWEYRFEPDTPLYLEIERSGVTIH
jgi:hypothetical protein